MFFLLLMANIVQIRYGIITFFFLSGWMEDIWEANSMKTFNGFGLLWYMVL